MHDSGSRDQLVALVPRLGLPCPWEHKGPSEVRVVGDGRSNRKLNWWPETGEPRLEGKPEPSGELEARLAARLPA